MYGLKLTIRPTSGLTFRRMPSSILHISTYPFLPPTTMSGFLRRLKFIEAGTLPEDFEPPEKRASKEPGYYVLPRQLCAVGAYPNPFKARIIHTTHRQGVRSFKHTAFSRLRRKADSKEVYQLHTWDYLMVETLHGYVLSEQRKLLEELRSVCNFGCKIGKEGYAFVENISPVEEMEQQQCLARPSTIVPGTVLHGVLCDVYPLYRYAWQTNALDFINSLSDQVPSPIDGFVPFAAGLVYQPIELDYYTDGEIFIPCALIKLLRGESDG